MAGSHALEEYAIHAQNFKCFGEVFRGWDTFLPINVVIGRNNSGKSTLLDVVNLAISGCSTFDTGKHGRTDKPFRLRVGEPIQAHIHRTVFPENSSGGVISENHATYGKRFTDNRIWREVDENFTVHAFDVIDHQEKPSGMHAQFKRKLASHSDWPIKQSRFLRIAAERDIQPEVRDPKVDIMSNGQGLTNAIRAFINSDSLPTEEITQGLLHDLNVIYKTDCEFHHLSTQESDEGVWEIFLHERGKSPVRLSESGSSLKTSFIVCAFLRLIPLVEELDWKRTVFSIEEPENNLHPSLLRRMLFFLADMREQLGFTLIITTHSPICIDWASRRDDSQILHVTHLESESIVKSAIGYADSSLILDDLDIRASDILQANGVIWVEGPSDRIYLNKWIELFTNGFLKEGLHYTIMFYAGKLLSHLDALAPDESSTLISLLTINRNLALLMDSDKHIVDSNKKPRLNINSTKRRIRDEIKDNRGYVWISDGREVENYIDLESLKILGDGTLRKVGRYDKVPESASLTEFKGNKITLAHAYAKIATVDSLETGDLKARVEGLCYTIKKWNHLAR
jgi:predicted ATPase